jgi:hypothetical protein
MANLERRSGRFKLPLWPIGHDIRKYWDHDHKSNDPESRLDQKASSNKGGDRAERRAKLQEMEKVTRGFDIEMVTTRFSLNVGHHSKRVWLCENYILI